MSSPKIMFYKIIRSTVGNLKRCKLFFFGPDFRYYFIITFILVGIKPYHYPLYQYLSCRFYLYLIVKYVTLSILKFTFLFSSSPAVNSLFFYPILVIFAIFFCFFKILFTKVSQQISQDST